MSSVILVEGGGHSKELQIRCREGFRKLLEACGFAGRMPRLYACGGRNSAFDDFQTSIAANKGHAYVALLIDSEDPVDDVEAPWVHLNKCDRWDRPRGVTDDQALLMTTCMETWIITDRRALAAYFGKPLLSPALPGLVDMEQRLRDDVQNSLVQATRRCPSPYRKGKRSFELLAGLSPATLEQHLPSFKRMLRILRRQLR